MSLVPFHRGLIAVAIVFCIGYGVWELVAYTRAGGGVSLGMGVAFVLLGGALAVYLRRLNRFLGYDGDRGQHTGTGRP